MYDSKYVSSLYAVVVLNWNDIVTIHSSVVASQQHSIIIYCRGYIIIAFYFVIPMADQEKEQTHNSRLMAARQA